MTGWTLVCVVLDWWFMCIDVATRGDPIDVRSVESVDESVGSVGP